MRRAGNIRYREPNPLEIYVQEQQDKKNGKKKSAVLTPLALVGGVSGALLHKSNVDASSAADRALEIGQARRAADVTDMRFDGVIPIDTSQDTYSGQVSDLLDSIVVATTNAGVVIYMNTKNGNVTLDVTPKEQLEGPDLEAYERMDNAYFKRAFLNQLNVDFASLENSVAKRVVDNHVKFNNALSKEAGISYIDAYDYSPVEVSKFLEDIKERYDNSAFDSFKDFVRADIESMFPDNAKVELRLIIKPENSIVTDRVLKRVHPGALNSFLSGSGIFEPGAAKEQVDIYYSDKAVAFLYGDKIVHTISVSDMTDDEHEAFQDRDDRFFKDRIEHSLRVGFAKVAGEDPRLEDELEKLAEEERLEVKDIFSRSDIHPIVYFTVLTSHFGDEWVDMEAAALIKAIEVEFQLDDEEPIADVPLNKILSMQVANNSDLVYSSYHAFEKVIRSFNSKPIDFGQREMEDLTLRDLVHGINILNRVTPYNNVYDSFSPDIYDYIVQILVKEEKYMWGVNLSGTEEETQFIGIINLSLVDKLIKHYRSKAKTEEQEGEVVRQTDQIFRACVMIIDEIRSRFSDYTGAGKFAEQMAKNLGYPETIVKRIVSEIVVNLSMDLFMQLEDERLHEQLVELGYAKEVEE